MAATAAKKAAVKKPAPELPPVVEINFDLHRETKGTYVWAEETDEDGLVLVDKLYTKKWFFEKFGFVPNEGTHVKVTFEVTQD